MLSINFPEKFTPGLTDNFVSNEVVFKDLDFDKILDGLLDAIRPVLSKHGLSVLQMPGGDGQQITITTILMHESGEWMESEPFTLKAQKVDPQGAGSAVTYGRRYSLSSILGVAWDTDDDGQAASKPIAAKPTITFQDAPKPANTNQPTKTQQKTQQQANVSVCKCHDCGETITEKVANFSSSKFKRPLCMKCQQKGATA